MCVLEAGRWTHTHALPKQTMALNRVSQLCHEITRLWLQLKMMTGRVCVCINVCDCLVLGKVKIVGILQVCFSLYAFSSCSVDSVQLLPVHSGIRGKPGEKGESTVHLRS